MFSWNTIMNIMLSHHILQLFLYSNRYNFLEIAMNSSLDLNMIA